MNNFISKIKEAGKILHEGAIIMHLNYMVESYNVGDIIINDNACGVIIDKYDEKVLICVSGIVSVRCEGRFIAGEKLYYDSIKRCATKIPSLDKYIACGIALTDSTENNTIAMLIKWDIKGSQQQK